MPANIKQTHMGADMDMTHYKLKGEALKEQILKDVKSSQVLYGMHLPDKMFITEDQFKSIEDDTERMDETEERMYITPMNVMEVKVMR